ncbi:MAG: histidine--tRNA ligase, partial [Candidatus Aenigmatarchaeota archaeon]
MKLQPPRGTRDFLPAEMSRRREMMERIRSVFVSYGYGEIQTPAFEDFELLAKKSGAEIEKEIYTFEDKSGRKLGLRFDLTVPVCRVVATNPNLKKPAKFYYITNTWRYDEPQKGRFREFWQAGVELVGSKSLESDAEILAVVSDALKAAGIKNFYFKINSRRIVEKIIEETGIAASKKEDVFRAIDKLGKTGEENVRKELEACGISAKNIEKFFSLIESNKSESREFEELQRIKEIAEAMGAENIRIDFSVVRGIGYYTGFVFEALVKGSENIGAIAGGGRYDSLIGIYSGNDVPATGFSIGVDRLMETVKSGEDFIPAKFFVASIDEKS